MLRVILEIALYLIERSNSYLDPEVANTATLGSLLTQEIPPLHSCPTSTHAGSRDPNSDPHTCPASALTTGQSPQSGKLFLQLEVPNLL